ncbi:50S ribosomal protein L23 [Candidatus Uhrbacteria bacterium]|nr:50S ribosomal protein L23 [Candidatus Uhrbacteria bacterium]
MAAGIRGLFKKDKKNDAVVTTQPPVASAQNKSDATEQQSAKSFAKKKHAEKLSVALRTILHPLVTEKTARLGTEGEPSVTFRVLASATKSDVKRAAKELYGAHVTSVQVINTPQRQTRTRFGAGRVKKGHKKAIVRFAPGSTVDITKFPTIS